MAPVFRMKYEYIERCAKGYVEFQTAEGPLQMWTGEPVDVPASLAAKLKNNNHFRAVSDEASEDSSDGQTDTPKRRGRPPKITTEQ